jgi:hypothetical protein
MASHVLFAPAWIGHAGGGIERSQVLALLFSFRTIWQSGEQAP